ncbi:MAG: 3-phosphoshikimate 1-carboxyvinyltransferase [Deltaproteobacteria bacterium]|nr:3-phosphoshikimate 1-carboxyvinyltransferase [Deltaproteobacteria bacterium]
MIEIRPLQTCNGVVVIPGSKSYTHRALIVSSLADGESILINALRSEDTDYTANALREFGIPIFWNEDQLHISGMGGIFKLPGERIFLGNSGTSMRFLTAMASLINGRIVLAGSDRMRKRPMVELFNGLQALGGNAYSREEDGSLSVVVESDGLRGGVVKMRGKESSQFLSGLLMVAPYAKQDVYVEITDSLVSNSYVDITLDVMDSYGIEVKREGHHCFSVPAGQRYSPRVYSIEADASSASYFFSAAAITKGRVRVENFNPYSIQADAGFLNLLEKMGCWVILGDSWAGVHGSGLHAIAIDMGDMPDLVPTLAVTAAFARGQTLIQNIGHLRLKESDRIAVLTTELRRMGIRVEEGEDWLKIEGGKGHGAEIDPHDDHRIAMSFAIAGLVIPGIKIKEPQCVKKSFPDFWEVFRRLYL